MKDTPSPRRDGFTLIEVAIVLVIAGVLVSMWAGFHSTFLEQKRLSLTRQRMTEIEKALQRYVSIKSDLPCPAGIDAPVNASEFGFEQVTDADYTDSTGTVVPVAGHCDDDADLDVPGNRVILAQGRDPDPADPEASVRVRIGTVPVRSLGLSDDYMFDGWGSRFVYAVSAGLTRGSQYFNQEHGSIDILTESGSTALYPPGSSLYALVSSGHNKRGGVTVDGTIPVPCTTTSIGLDRDNCDYLFEATPEATFTHSILISRKEGDPKYFDDYVRYSRFLDSGAVQQLAERKIVAFHSQTNIVPACPPSWQPVLPTGGYSYAGLSYRQSGIVPDLGGAASRLPVFKPLLVRRCRPGSCGSLVGSDRTLWLTSRSGFITETINGTVAPPTPPNTFGIGRCQLCARTAQVQVMHSYNNTIPNCPDSSWTTLWTGYSLAMMTVLDGGGGQVDLSSPGSCLRQFKPMPIAQCYAGPRCVIEANNESSFWLVDGPGYANPPNQVPPPSTPYGAARCRVCASQ